MGGGRGVGGRPFFIEPPSCLAQSKDGSLDSDWLFGYSSNLAAGSVGGCCSGAGLKPFI